MGVVQGEMAKLHALSEQEYVAFENECKQLAKVRQAAHATTTRTPDSQPQPWLLQVISTDRFEHETGAREYTVSFHESRRGELTMEQEAELKKKIADTSWLINKDKAQIQQTQDKVATYEQAFNKIQVCALHQQASHGHDCSLTHTVLLALRCCACLLHLLRTQPASQILTKW